MCAFRFLWMDAVDIDRSSLQKASADSEEEREAAEELRESKRKAKKNRSKKSGM